MPLSPSEAEELALAGEKALGELWARGEAWRVILDSGQQAWRNALYAGKETLFEGQGDSVYMVSRQRGKSFYGLAIVDEVARKHPGSIFRCVGKTAESTAAMVIPNFQAVHATCPEEYKPALKERDGLFEWPNGSTLVWAGTDNQQFDRLRGPRCHGIIFEESAFYSDLERVELALRPQLQTTKGFSLYLSTPPESPAHPFYQRYLAAMAMGKATHGTIYDNPRLTSEEVERILTAEGRLRGMELEAFKKSTYCRREFFAEVVTEETRAAVPGWTQERAKALVQAVERPLYFDAYVGVDFGFGDPHAAVFGWWDITKNTLVIEDELLLSQANTQKLAQAIQEKERQLYGTTLFEGTLWGARDWHQETGLPEFLIQSMSEKAPRQPYFRVGDNDLLVLSDLVQLHGLAVLPTRKDDKALAVDELDVMVREGRILIHPRCTQLVEQLYATVWNKARTSWERNAKGHGDLLDALVYLARNVRKHLDPRPKPVDIWQQHTSKRETHVLANAFGFK